MTRYLDLAEYLWLAEQVKGISADVLTESGRIELADSALHAPMASFGGDDFYPDIVDKAAVLCWRLARNHSLPDGNKRAAWISRSRQALIELLLHVVPVIANPRNSVSELIADRVSVWVVLLV